MFYAPYPNKQINIPYLLKIGSGKVKKIGKYRSEEHTSELQSHSDLVSRLLL